MYTHEEAVTLVRAHTWNCRDEVVDYLLLHDCERRDIALAMLVLLGWGQEAFILAALADEYGPLDD